MKQNKDILDMQKLKEFITSRLHDKKYFLKISFRNRKMIPDGNINLQKAMKRTRCGDWNF